MRIRIYLRTPMPNCMAPLLLMLVSAFQISAGAEHSALWGAAGERWEPQSRLPDFSYAGYHRGEKALPELRASVSVRSFGAKGDGTTDDTAAFQMALQSSEAGVIAVPPGRYKVTDFLEIRRSGVVLQGAGPESSVLIFPKPLNEIKPNWGATTTGQRTSNYSWSGGFIRISGSLSQEQRAQVTAPAKRGDQSLEVSSCEGLKVGDDIRLVMKDTADNHLARHLYAGDPGPMENLKGRSRESFVCRLTKVNLAARRVEFDRPLRVDVQLEWSPRIYSARSSVEEVGVEGLGFEFPNTPYRGHFTELGYNAIAVGGARNCWLRNLRIHNSDSGIFVSGINNTLHHILITSDRSIERSRNATGHHGVTLGGQDNLVSGFELRTRFMHDFTMTRGSAGNVVASGRGPDLCFDHHRYGPHANLFTDIDLGVGSRMFQSGGGAKLGRHSAAYETFWNIRAEKPQSWPAGWGPDLMNLIGVRSDGQSIKDPEGRWFEAIDPGQLQPADLHQAQLARRLRQETAK